MPGGVDRGELASSGGFEHLEHRLAVIDREEVGFRGEGEVGVFDGCAEDSDGGRCRECGGAGGEVGEVVRAGAERRAHEGPLAG